MSQRTLVVSLFVCLAGAAHAGPSVDLVWRQTGTATINANTVGSSTVTADVVLRADATSVEALGISFLYDEEGGDELDHLQSSENLLVDLPGMGNFFVPFVAGTTLDFDSSPTSPGLVTRFDLHATPIGSGAISTTVTLGSLVMSINFPRVADDGPDIRPFVLNNGIDGIIDSNGNLIEDQTTFNGASVVGTALPLPVCDVESNQPLYTSGQIVRMNVVRFANPSGVPQMVNLRLEITLPSGQSFDLINEPVGIPNGLDVDFAPFTLFTVDGRQPLGDWELRCAFENQANGQVIFEDVTPFTLQ